MEGFPVMHTLAPVSAIVVEGPGAFTWVAVDVRPTILIGREDVLAGRSVMLSKISMESAGMGTKVDKGAPVGRVAVNVDCCGANQAEREATWEGSMHAWATTDGSENCGP